MSYYLMLGNYTDKGINNIKDSAERITKFKELCSEHGAKLISYYLLMGPYDVASVIEAPTPEVIAQIALIVGQRGNVRTQTMCAFSETDQNKMVQKI